MKLKTGLKRTNRLTVTNEMTAIAMSSGAMEVYATPMMIAAMEENCMLLAAENLEGNDTTVGSLVNIKHLAPSPVGAKITVDCELIEIDGRRLVFTVTARDDEDIIGEGTHERFVVDKLRFMQKVENKKKMV